MKTKDKGNKSHDTDNALVSEQPGNKTGTKLKQTKATSNNPSLFSSPSTQPVWVKIIHPYEKREGVFFINSEIPDDFKDERLPEGANLLLLWLFKQALFHALNPATASLKGSVTETFSATCHEYDYNGRIQATTKGIEPKKVLIDTIRDTVTQILKTKVAEETKPIVSWSGAITDIINTLNKSSPDADLTQFKQLGESIPTLFHLIDTPDANILNIDLSAFMKTPLQYILHHPESLVIPLMLLDHFMLKILGRVSDISYKRNFLPIDVIKKHTRFSTSYQEEGTDIALLRSSMKTCIDEFKEMKTDDTRELASTASGMFSTAANTLGSIAKTVVKKFVGIETNGNWELLLERWQAAIESPQMEELFNAAYKNAVTNSRRI